MTQRGCESFQTSPDICFPLPSAPSSSLVHVVSLSVERGQKQKLVNLCDGAVKVCGGTGQSRAVSSLLVSWVIMGNREMLELSWRHMFHGSGWSWHMAVILKCDLLTLQKRAADGNSTHRKSRTPSAVRILFLVLSLRFSVFSTGSGNTGFRGQTTWATVFRFYNMSTSFFCLASTSAHLK